MESPPLSTFRMARGAFCDGISHIDARTDIEPRFFVLDAPQVVQSGTSVISSVFTFSNNIIMQPVVHVFWHT